MQERTLGGLTCTSTVKVAVSICSSGCTATEEGSGVMPIFWRAPFSSCNTTRPCVLLRIDTASPWKMPTIEWSSTWWAENRACQLCEYYFLGFSGTYSGEGYDHLTFMSLSPMERVPSASAAPPGMILVMKMPLSPSTCMLSLPPAILKPRPVSTMHIRMYMCIST